MTRAASFVVTGKPTGTAYGNLMDLTRLQRGADAEICDHCNTINLGNAQFCKGCAHRLPGYCEESQPLEAAVRASPPSRQAGGIDLLAFCVVIHALVFVTMRGALM